jgi:ribose 1,5-bisphosphokinase
MNERLIYVMGPSGAGKDSVLAGLQAAWSAAAPLHWARRTITRSAQPGGEAHEPADPQAFAALHEAGAFAMHWQANGLCYGIRHTELAPLRQGAWVLVNGSRAWLPELQRRWPGATLVFIGASPQVLAQRLAARGREDPAAIAQRLARQVPVALPEGAIRIDNDHQLADAVQALRLALLARDPRRSSAPTSHPGVPTHSATPSPNARTGGAGRWA